MKCKILTPQHSQTHLIVLFQIRSHWRFSWRSIFYQLQERRAFLLQHQQHRFGTYWRCHRVWVCLFRNPLVFFLQPGCIPWCKQKAALWTSPIWKVQQLGQVHRQPAVSSLQYSGKKKLGFRSVSFDRNRRCYIQLQYIYLTDLCER